MPSPFPPQTRLAAYLRDSGGDDQDLSVPQQESVITQWCTNNDYILTHIFKDIARPGSTTIGREQFLAMVAHFREPSCQEQGIIIWKFSRFARDMDDAQFYKADLRRRGFTIHALEDTIPDGINGRFFESAIDWANAKFLEDLSEDVKRGLTHNVNEFGALGGIPPFGFKREAIDVGNRRDGSAHILHRWVPDEDLIPIVKAAFRLRAEGTSYSNINRQLRIYKSNNCYPTFFNNALYIGILHFGEKTIPNYCEPVIDTLTWEAVQKIIEQRSLLNSPNNPDHPRRANSPYILSGMVYCTRCGSSMNGHTVKPKNYDEPFEYYACSRQKRHAGCDALKIPKRPLENAVLQVIQEQIITGENIIQMYTVVQNEETNRVQDRTKRIEDLNRKLTNMQRQIGNLTEVITEAGSKSRHLVEKLTTLEHQENEIIAQIAILESDPPEPPILDHNRIAEIIAAIQTSLQTADPITKHQILRGFIARIDVERHQKTILGMVTYYLPDLKKNTHNEFMPMDGVRMGAPSHRHKFQHSFTGTTRTIR